MPTLEQSIELISVGAILVLQIATMIREARRSRPATLSVYSDGTRQVNKSVVSFRFDATGQEDVKRAFAEIKANAQELEAALRKTRAQKDALVDKSAEPTVYDQAFVYINGKLLGHAESMSVGVERKIGVGLETARTLRARVVSFVPRGGFEFDGFKFANSGDAVELKIRFGSSGAELRTNGHIAFASIVSSADGTRLEVEFNGEPAVFVIPEHPIAASTAIQNKP